MLAYVSDTSGAPQIFIHNLKTKQSKQLSYLTGAASPFIDARAEWVYFTGVDQSGNSDIYKIKTDGSGLTRLTFDPEIEKYPSLTKFGKWSFISINQPFIAWAISFLINVTVQPLKQFWSK